MNNITCKIKNSDTYEDTIETLKSPEGLLIFKDSREWTEDRPLSKNERLVYVNEALKSTEDKEARERLEHYRTELLSAPKKNYFEQVTQDSRFNIKISTPSAFLTFLSPELNLELFKDIKKDIYRHTECDLDAEKIITDTESLNNSLNSLKQELITTLRTRLGIKQPYLESLSLDAQYSQYVDLMQKAEKILWKLQIEQRLSRNGKIQEQTSSLIREEVLEPLKAYVMLANFDEIMERMSNGLVKVLPEYKGLFIADDIKWEHKVDSYYEHSFLDGFSQVDGSHTTTNQLKTAVSQIEIPGSKGTLSGEVIRQIITHLNHNYRDIGVSKDYYTLFDPNSTDNSGRRPGNAEKKNALLNLLKNDMHLRSKVGEAKCDAVYNWFNKYLKVYAKNMPSDGTRADFEATRDLLGQLVSTIINQQHTIFIETTEDGNTTVTNVDRGQRKVSIYEAVVSQAKDNFKNGYDMYYNPGWEIADTLTLATITDIASSRALQVLQKIFGFPFSNNSMQSKFDNEDNLMILGDVTRKISELYFRYFKTLGDTDNEESINNAASLFKDELTRSQEFKLFSDIIVSDQATQLHTNKDQNMNTLPGESIYYLTGDFKNSLNEFKRHFVHNDRKVGPEGGTLVQHNILSDIPELTKVSFSGENDKADGAFVGHSCFRSDVCIKDKSGKSIITSPILLEPIENAYVSLNYDYLRSIISGDVMYLQVAEYSDKPRIPLMAYNMLAELLIQKSNGEYTSKKHLYEFSADELKEIIKILNKNYYNKIETKIANKYSQILGKYFDNIQQVLEYLDSNPISEDALHDLIYNYLQSGKSINFIKDADYVIINGYVRLNPSLLLKIASAKQDKVFDSIYEENERAFLENIKDLKEDLRINVGKLSNKDKYKLCTILGYESKGEADDFSDFSSDQLDNFLKGKWNLKDSNGNLVFERELKRYFALQTLLKDADLQVSLKMPWVHDTKTAINLSAAEVNTLFNGEKEAADIIANVLKNDLSVRYIKGTKRNSAGVTTLTRMDTDNVYGVGKTFKMAIAGFPVTKVLTHFGFRDECKGHDGASFTNPIFAFLEEHSYRGHEYRGAKKTIGIIQTEYGITQVKHADYVLSNEVLRRSFHNPDGKLEEDQFSGDNLMKVMLTPCKLTDAFIQNYKENLNKENKLSHLYPIYVFNGRAAQLVNVTINENNRFKFDWQYLDDGTFVDSKLLIGLIDSDSKELETENNFDGNFKIDNLYDLWQAFGGSEAMEETTNGELIYTEANNALIGQLISEFDPSGTMKQSMIAKICDPNSIKSGQMCVNKAKDLVYRRIITSTVNSNSFGVQQDYTHESEDARIPALTLVLTAIAFNGHNQEMVQMAYESLGRIIQQSLQPFLSRTNNPLSLNRYLGEKLLRTLQQNTVASTAVEIVEDFLNQLSADKVLALSHKDLFNKVTSDLVSMLNRDTIKQTFAGIAVIQTPSLGILGLYEDRFGNKYTRSDILKLANADKKLFEGVNKLLKPQELVERYIDLHLDLFGDIEITNQNIHLIGVGDCVSISNNEIENAKPEFKRISDPTILIKLLKEIRSGKSKVTKLLKYQRDLKTSNITWQELSENGYQTINIFETDAFDKMINGKTEKDKQIGRLWFNLNLSLLKQNKYIKDFELLKLYIASKGEKGVTVPITNLNHKLGEQVIPKVHTAFATGNSSLSEILADPNYFEEKVRKDLEIKTKLSDYEVGIATTGAEIILSNKEISEDKINTRIEYDPIERRLCVKDLSGEILCYISRKLIETDNGYIDQSTEKQKLAEFNRALSNFKAELFDVNDKRALRIYLQPIENYRYEDQLYDAIQAIDGGYDRHINNIEAGNKVLNLNIDKFKHRIIKGKTAEESIKAESLAVYNSWKLQHFAVSTRIPSQSYLSFLPVETVAYTENNLNLGYMNIWEMLFQGSDFDIDKAYTLMFGVSKSGRVQGNYFTDYSSVENILKSLLLPLPTYKHIDKFVEGSSIDQILLSLKTSYTTLAIAIKENNYDVIKNIINAINNIKGEIGIQDEPIITDATESASKIFVIEALNNYLHESQEGLKNRVANAIFIQSKDLENLESSETPMSMTPVTERISKVLKKKFLEETGEPEKNFSEDQYYLEYDPFTIFKIQRNNSVGKQDVGIAANGIKAAGALHKHFNTIYNELTSEQIKNKSIEYQRSRMKIDLSFTTKKGRNIGNFSFFKLANTVVNRVKFEEILKSEYGQIDINGNLSYASHNDYPTFVALRNTKGKAFTENDSEKLQTLQMVYNIYKELYGRYPNSFVDFLYFAQRFEDNVADTISIFISMATDNAKELALAKINGTPELLSMPLAMITLGMNIESTVDVCINILGDVAEKLQKNRFEDASNINIRQAIQGLKGYNQETIKSLLKVYDFAQELRSITSFFKVNQGVDTKYAELSSWLVSMANDRWDKYNNRKAEIEQIDEEREIRLKKPLDYVNLFIDESDEQKNVLADYDLSKTVVNVMDVVLKSPHFRGQLSATGQVIDKLNLMSGKAFLISNLVKSFDNFTEEQNSSYENTFGLSDEDVRKKGNRASLVRKTINLIDHWVITNYLKTKPGLDLSISDIKRKYKTSDFNALAGGTISLDNANGIQKFINFVNKDLVPYLQDSFPANVFVEGLERKTDRRTGITYYDFRYDPYSLRENPALMDNYNTALKEFELLKNTKTGIHSSTGREFSIGELLYLYSIITGKGEVRGLYTIVGSVSKESDLLAGGIESMYESLDYMAQHQDALININAKNENTEGQTNKDFLYKLVNYLQPYVKALNETDKKYTFLLNGNELELDLNKHFLYTLNELTTSQGISIDAAIRTIERTIPFTKVNYQRNGDTGLFQITTWNQRGSVITSPQIEIDLSYRPSDSERKNPILYSSNFGELKEKLIGEVLGVSKYILNPEINAALQDKNTALSEFLSIDTKYENILEIIDYITSGKSILRADNTGSNYIQRINGKVLIVTDPNNFIGEDRMLYAVDLFVQSLDSQPISEHEKIAALINYFSGTIICNSDNWEEVIKNIPKESELFEKINLHKKLIIDYTDFLLNRSELENMTRLGRQELFRYENALSYKEAYYSNYFDLASGVTIEPGDIVRFLETVNGEKAYVEKLCFGKDLNNRLWFIPISNLDKDIKAKTYSLSDKKIQGVKKLSSNPEVTYGLITEDLFNYNSDLFLSYDSIDVVINGKPADLRLEVGDKFNVNKKYYFVSDVIFFQTMEGISRRYILRTHDNKLALLHKGIGGWGIVNKGSILVQRLPEKISVKHPSGSKLIKSNDKFKGRKYKYDLTSSLKEYLPIKEYLKEKIDKGAIIKVNDQYLDVIYRNGNILYTINGDIDVSNVEEVGFTANMIDSDSFFERLRPKRMTVKENSLIPWRPDISDGFIKQKGIRRETEVLTSAIPKFGSDNKPVWHPAVSIPGNFIDISNTENAPVNIGDIYITYDLGNTTVIQVIKKVNNNSYIVKKSVFKFDKDYNIQSDEKPQFEIAKTESLKNYNHYTDHKNASYLAWKSSYYQLHELTQDDACTNFLLHIQKVTGLGVRMVNDANRKDNAIVTENGIEINLAKKPVDVSTNAYIMNLAAHEFMHVILANMKAKNPTAYYELILEFKSTLLLDNPESNDSKELKSLKDPEMEKYYDSETLIFEEMFVRRLGETIQDLKDYSKAGEEFEEYITKFFGSAYTSLANSDLTLAKYLQRFKSVNCYEKGIDIQLIKHLIIAEKLFDGIIRIC